MSALSAQLPYLYRQAARDYPLQYPVSEPLICLLADAYISFDQTDIPTALTGVPSIYLAELHYTGGEFRAVTNWSTGDLFIDTNGVTPLETDWGAWKVMDWVVNNKLLRLLFSVDAIDALTDPTNITGLNLPFLARVLDVRVKRFTGFVVNSTLIYPDGTNADTDTDNGSLMDRTLAGNITFVPGYNVTQTENPTSTLTSTPLNTSTTSVPTPPSGVIEIDCVPGSGLGYYPGCTTPPLYLRLLNGVNASNSNGNLTLNAKGCYYTEVPANFPGAPPGTSPRRINSSPGQLQLNNSCTACSDCDDYSRLYQKLVTIYGQAVNLQDRFTTLMGMYNNMSQMALASRSLLTQTAAGFSLSLVNEYNVVNFQVDVKSGMSTSLGSINVNITPPTGYTLYYQPTSGLVSATGEEWLPSDTLFAASNGMSFTYTESLELQETVSFRWQLRIVPYPQPDLADPVVQHTLSFTANVTATDSTNPGSPVTLATISMVRTVPIFY